MKIDELITLLLNAKGTPLEGIATRAVEILTNREQFEISYYASDTPSSRILKNYQKRLHRETEVNLKTPGLKESVQNLQTVKENLSLVIVESEKRTIGAWIGKSGLISCVVSRTKREWWINKGRQKSQVV